MKKIFLPDIISDMLIWNTSRFFGLMIAIIFIINPRVSFSELNPDNNNGKAVCMNGSSDNIETARIDEDTTLQKSINIEERSVLLQFSADLRYESGNFGTFISSQQIERFADYTVQDALTRVVGMQVDRRRTINFRGVGHHQYYVTLDGQRIGTTGAGNRSFDLGSIASDLIQDLEVIKVLTPDMDADALAGSINLRTQIATGEQRHLNVNVGGGANTRYFPFTGSNSRISMSYSEAVRDNIVLAAYLSHMSDYRGWESLDVAYDVADFGAGPEDVIERVAAGIITDGRNRSGGGFQLIYQPSEYVKYRFRGLINMGSQERIGHMEGSSVNSDWLRVDTTGAVGRQGTHHYDMSFLDSQTQLIVVQASARRHINDFIMEFSAGWSQNRLGQEDFLFPFMLQNLDFSIDMENRARPVVQPSNIRLMDDGTVNRQTLRLQKMNRIVEKHTDNTFSGRVDAEIPFGSASFKLGSSALLTLKDGDFSNESYRYRRTLTAFRFGPIKSRTGNFKIFNKNEYMIPWLVDAHEARMFLASNPEDMLLDYQSHAHQSHIWNYSALERIFAGYFMTNINLIDNLTITGGLRVEHEVSDREGNRIRINEMGGFEIFAPLTQNTNNTHLFPNVQLLFSPLANTDVRMAYSKSIGRPDFYFLAPFERINDQDSTLFRGNPNLNPTTSDNLDVLVNQYLGNSGSLSIGLFHKQLSGFVFHSTETLTDGDFSGYQEISIKNSDESATIYGIEISLQQYLGFLPGFLGNFGIYANYTWSHSVFMVNYRDEKVRFPGQSPHVINAALDYSQGRLSTQLSWHWTAEALVNLQRMPVRAPAIDPVNVVYKDYFQDGWTDISASLKFRLSDKFIFWADASNFLGGKERIQYANSRTDYPIGIDMRGQLSFHAGIQYRL